MTPKKWKNGPQKLLIISQNLLFHSPAHSPQLIFHIINMFQDASFSFICAVNGSIIMKGSFIDRSDRRGQNSINILTGHFAYSWSKLKISDKIYLHLVVTNFLDFFCGCHRQYLQNPRFEFSWDFETHFVTKLWIQELFSENQLLLCIRQELLYLDLVDVFLKTVAIHLRFQQTWKKEKITLI